jgi:hypothetical protein
MTNLPPLPKPAQMNTMVFTGPDWHRTVLQPLFREDQMHEYGALCRKQALEEAVKACADIDDRCHECLGQNEHEFCTVPSKEDYVEAIKKLLTLP